VARHAELRQELDEILKQSEGWLKEEIEERVVQEILKVFVSNAAVHASRAANGLLANARRAFKED